MGVYPQWGVEYAVELATGHRVVVVSVAQADARLLVSAYYVARKPFYDRNPVREWRVATSLLTEEVDFGLTEPEQEALAAALAGGAVRTHGWFDVGYLHWTL